MMFHCHVQGLRSTLMSRTVCISSNATMASCTEISSREEYGFGIYEEDCVYVTSDFNCEERCLDTFTTAQQCKLHLRDEILIKRFSFSINVLFMNE